MPLSSQMLDQYLDLKRSLNIDDLWKWVEETTGAEEPFLSEISNWREEIVERADGSIETVLHSPVFALNFSSEIAATLFKLRWL